MIISENMVLTSAVKQHPVRKIGILWFFEYITGIARPTNTY